MESFAQARWATEYPVTVRLPTFKPMKNINGRYKFLKWIARLCFL
jgi:hypothetical protein